VPTVTCSGLQAATIGPFKQSAYTLAPAPKPPGPCPVCAPFGPSGQFIDRAADGTTTPAKRKGGATLRFKASAPGDLIFTFRGPVEAGKNARNRGGFVYAAHQGKNKLRFTGAIRPRRPLAPGLYTATVTTVDGNVAQQLMFDIERR
jgi:hypothetical protein